MTSSLFWFLKDERGRDGGLFTQMAVPASVGSLKAWICRWGPSTVVDTACDMDVSDDYSSSRVRQLDYLDSSLCFEYCITCDDNVASTWEWNESCE